MHYGKGYPFSRPVPRLNHFRRHPQGRTLRPHKAHRGRHGADMGSTSQKVTRQQGQVGYDQHDHTLGIGEPRHPLYARPQAPRLLRQHQPQQGTPRTPRPYPPLPRRMRRRPLELLDKGASNPEAEDRPARPGTAELARRRTAV